MDILRAAVLLLTLLWLPINLFGQSTDYKVRKVILSTSDSIIKTGVWNESLKQTANTEYNYYWYYAGAINHNFGSNSGKLLHGKYEVFDNQQKLICQGNFEYGIMSGNWYRWYSNGNIQSVCFYKKGLLHGTAKFYSKDEQLLSALNYKKGLLHGKSFYYLPDKILIKDYKDGKEIVKSEKNKKPKPTLKPIKNISQPSVQKDSLNAEVKPKKKWWQFNFLKKKNSNKQELKPIEHK